MSCTIVVFYYTNDIPDGHAGIQGPMGAPGARGPTGEPGNKGEINVKGLYWLWVNVLRKTKNILGREKCT